MATSTPNLPRKLSEKIDGQDVYVAELVNDDYDRRDEILDDFDELERQKADLQREVDDTEAADVRRELRARIRELTKQQRSIDTQMLGIYIEDKDGNPFDQEVLEKTPVRVQNALMTQAAQKIEGDTEGPTPGSSAAR